MSKEDSQHMRRVTVTLPQELVDVLNDIAEDARVSVSERPKTVAGVLVWPEEENIARC